jgi:hypothetical protein
MKVTVLKIVVMILCFWDITLWFDWNSLCLVLRINENLVYDYWTESYEILNAGKFRKTKVVLFNNGENSICLRRC